MILIMNCDYYGIYPVVRAQRWSNIVQLTAKHAAHAQQPAEGWVSELKMNKKFKTPMTLGIRA